MTAKTATAPKTGMTPEAAWAEAMKFENRPNPYPFFDELRKTPVAHVANTSSRGYQELVQITHDPHLSSDTRRLKARAAGAPSPEADSLESYGPSGSFITLDPPEHDTARRQAMR